MSEHKPTAGFWATVVLTALLAYAASFGPACWVNERTGVGSRVVAIVYRPIFFLAPSPNCGGAGAWVLWYARRGSRVDAWPVVVNGELIWLRSI
jgi:hypothetical protein